MDRFRKSLIVTAVITHSALIACYTFPGEWVPVRLRYWSQAYARILFHQDWRLFAPDPPECGCSIVIKDEPKGPAVRLEDLHRGFIWKRMAANACRYAEASYHRELKHVVPVNALQVSLFEMTGRDPQSDGSAMHVLRSRHGWPELWEIRFAQTPGK